MSYTVSQSGQRLKTALKVLMVHPHIPCGLFVEQQLFNISRLSGGF